MRRLMIIRFLKSSFFRSKLGKILSLLKLHLLIQIINSKTAISGLSILMILIAMTIYAVIAIPLESFKQWNNPNYWIDYPKAAAPSWTNLGLFGPRYSEHIILDTHDARVYSGSQNSIHIISHTYSVDFKYDSYPTDFMIPYSVKYGLVPPAIEVKVLRPDGHTFKIYDTALPPGSTQPYLNPNYPKDNYNEYSGRIFSTDYLISKNLHDYLGLFAYPQDESSPQVMIFSELNSKKVLKGVYKFEETFYFFNDTDKVNESGLVLGGTVYGLMGTDDLRRDLSIGIFWGTPVALFIGVTVSLSSVFIGLIYGVVAGYKGKRTDEALMRVNDLIVFLPALPILILITATLGRSIFIITVLLVIFGWAGATRVSRSLALQIKNLQYIEAARIMGASDLRIIFKHIIPQLLPLTFASIAIAVPGAILAEAALSFLGLGDPTIPTWGQILHDANSADAAARGLWWWIIPPGMMIALTGLSFALIGKAIETHTDPLHRS
jgi:peptide/nickel transport system permease protein